MLRWQNVKSTQKKKKKKKTSNFAFMINKREM